jgi:hypothetical protein
MSRTSYVIIRKLDNLGSQLLNLCSSFKVSRLLQAVTWEEDLEMYGNMVLVVISRICGGQNGLPQLQKQESDCGRGASSSASKKMQEWLEEAKVMFPYQIGIMMIYSDLFV